MSEQPEIDEDGTSSNLIGGALEAISGTSIPEPVKKNFLKALDRLCTAAIEIPASYMEGIALEKRAETAARIKLIEKSSNEIAQQMQFDPEYAKAAVKKFGHRVIREQVNLDIIAEKAASTIAKDSAKETPRPAGISTEVNDDWLNVFEKEACQKSTEEMQSIFAKILAGEVSKPNTFSIKSIRLLGSLDQQTAKQFKKLCSMCISLHLKTDEIDKIIDARIPSLGRNAASNGLGEFGITFDSLNLLQEHGLIIPDYNSWMDYRAAFVVNGSTLPIPLTFGGKQWGLTKQNNPQGSELKITGIALTNSGKELMQIMEADENPRFSAALTAWLESQEIHMMQVQTK